MSGSYVLMRNLSRTKDTAAVVKDRIQQHGGAEVLKVVLFDDDGSNERFALVELNMPITSRLKVDALDIATYKSWTMEACFLMPAEDVFSMTGR